MKEEESLFKFVLNEMYVGMNVALVNLPMSMAFAKLASLSPVVGIFSAFWASVASILSQTQGQVSCVLMSVSIIIGQIREQEDQGAI